MNNETYSIPIRFRKMENLHIVFWLLKDLSWCMVWRPLGIVNTGYFNHHCLQDKTIYE
jgi:hypothetical protein